MRERLTTGLGFSSSPIPDDSMLRTPSAIEGEGGAISEDDARAKGRMVQVRDQVAQLAFENGLRVPDGVASSLLPTLRASDGYERRNQKTMDRIAAEGGDMTMPTLARTVLLPTPQTMDGLPALSPEKIAESKERTPAGYSNLRESVINDLLPTPTAVDGNTVAQSELDADDPKHRLKVAAQVLARKSVVNEIDWGKFQPAIERWEKIIGREAPAPTKPDGKDGAHRLSSKLTEWMMGLPDGWITSVGLTRNEELKACGNGVVPQQAALALSILLKDVEGVSL